MFTLPSPLHPALVHFPIVLILFGTMGAAAAIFFHRGPMPRLAAGLLACGAAGAIAATWSGEAAAQLVGELSPAAEQLLDLHEDWAERTRAVALGAVAALAASACVAQTGHYGGQMVYKHGVGINTAAAQSEAAILPANNRQREADSD